MFHYFVRDMALGGEPDRMTPSVIVSRLIGASVAVSLVGGSSIFAVMLVGKALAWAAVAVAGFWFAGWMFGLPALRRQLRDEPLARIAIDVVHRVLVWTLPLQAVVFMTVAIIAASEMLGEGGGYGTPAENLYEGLMTSVFVFAFLLAFGGMVLIGGVMIVGDIGGGGLGWKILGWLLVLAGIAVFFPGFLYLEDAMLALQAAWGPGRASLAILGGELLASSAIMAAFRSWLGGPVGSVCVSGPEGLALVATGQRLRVLRLDDGGEVWASPTKQPLCAVGAQGRLCLHDVPGDLVVVRSTANGQVQTTLGPLNAPLTAGALSPDGRLTALLDEDGYLSVWTTAEGARLWEQDAGFGDDGLGLTFAQRDGRLLASRRGGKVVAYDPSTGQALTEHDSAQWVDGDAFTQTRPHPEGRAWTVKTTDEAWAFSGPPEAPTRGPSGRAPAQDDGTTTILTAAATTADGALLAVTDGRRCAVYRTPDQARASRLLAQRDFGEKGVRALALTDDGAQVVIAGKGGVARWDLHTDSVQTLASAR